MVWKADRLAFNFCLLDALGWQMSYVVLYFGFVGWFWLADGLIFYTFVLLDGFDLHLSWFSSYSLLDGFGLIIEEGYI